MNSLVFWVHHDYDFCLLVRVYLWKHSQYVYETSRNKLKRQRSNDLRSLGGHYLLWSLCWFSIDRSIIITKCTRKGICKQHLLCNTPLLKLNQLESGRHIPDTSHVHSLNTLNGCDHRHTMAEKRWELCIGTPLHIEKLGGYPRTSVWQSLSTVYTMQ